MYVERHTVAVTTASDGSATAYTPVVTGKISAIHYVKTDFADGSTFTITAEATGETIWTETGVNASTSRAPRRATHTTAGVAATYNGTQAILDDICVAKDRVKIVIASGGNVKTANFYVVVS